MAPGHYLQNMNSKIKCPTIENLTVRNNANKVWGSFFDLLVTLLPAPEHSLVVVQKAFCIYITQLRPLSVIFQQGSAAAMEHILCI